MRCNLRQLNVQITCDMLELSTSTFKRASMYTKLLQGLSEKGIINPSRAYIWQIDTVVSVTVEELNTGNILSLEGVPDVGLNVGGNE